MLSPLQENNMPNIDDIFLEIDVSMLGWVIWMDCFTRIKMVSLKPLLNFKNDN